MVGSVLVGMLCAHLLCFAAMFLLISKRLHGFIALFQGGRILAQKDLQIGDNLSTFFIDGDNIIEKLFACGIILGKFAFQITSSPAI